MLTLNRKSKNRGLRQVYPSVTRTLELQASKLVRKKSVMPLPLRIAIRSAAGIVIILLLYLIEWILIPRGGTWTEGHLGIVFLFFIPFPMIVGGFLFGYLSFPLLESRISLYLISDPAIYVFVGYIAVEGGTIMTAVGLFGFCVLVPSSLGITLGALLYKKLQTL
ncbi:MAG: hypothetical protein KJ970_03285 [Candidatus Eisenbacteria bacterium]|uniref:Uncharacterized protein n=1 Tax=Eiseniibacteriota bacterium TaxID=2212470 RepID=A0A948RUH1_UNCEI|nr:hypothetical protein [Candidatus Eisenbacteria bacterium]